MRKYKYFTTEMLFSNVAKHTPKKHSLLQRRRHLGELMRRLSSGYHTYAFVQETSSTGPVRSSQARLIRVSFIPLFGKTRGDLYELESRLLQYKLQVCVRRSECLGYPAHMFVVAGRSVHMEAAVDFVSDTKLGRDGRLIFNAAGAALEPERGPGRYDK